MDKEKGVPKCFLEKISNENLIMYCYWNYFCKISFPEQQNILRISHLYW